MKLNWGWGIVLALAGFISFIMYFFIQAQITKQDDLVSEEYYDEGLLHDQRQVWIANANSLSSDLEIERFENGNVGLIFPEELHTQKLTGEIMFKRSNNAKIDVKHTLNEEMLGSVAFGSDKFIRGTYRFKAKVTAGDKTYYWDRNFTY